MRFFTTTLTSGTLIISASDGANFLSVQADSSAGQFKVLGGIPFKSVLSTDVLRTPSQGVNFSSQSPASPLDGITITWVAGNVDIIVGF